MREENEQYYDEEEVEEYVERTAEEQREAERCIAYLNEAKKAFLELDKLEQDLENAKGEEKRAKKAILSEEKSIQDDKDKAVSKKRQEIENHFEGEKKKNREKEKSILSKRTKQKNEQVQDRIKEETAELKKENIKLKQDIHQMYKKKGVPSICNRKWYYIMFIPDSIKEVFQFLFGLIITLVCIPLLACVGLYFSGKVGASQLWFYYVLIFAIWDILLLILYIFMINTTKVRYYNTLIQGKNIWNEIKSNEKKIIKIENKIKNDKDETRYDLQSYDKQLEEVKKEMIEIENERTKALNMFEKEEKEHIISQVDQNRKQGYQMLKDKHTLVLDKIQEYEQMLKSQKEKIEQEYIKKLGKDYIEEDVLDELISIIEEEEANNIEEAIEVYNG